MSLMYVKLDMTHPSYGEAFSICRDAFVLAYPKNLMATVTNPELTMQWVETVPLAKVTGSGAVLEVEINSSFKVWQDNAVWNPAPDLF